jgi:hypothetical protein
VWSGVLVDILVKVFKRDRNNAERLILQGHLNAMNKGYVVTMASAAAGILKADDDKYLGAHKGKLCAVFARHGIQVPCCDSKGCVIFP